MSLTAIDLEWVASALCCSTDSASLTTIILQNNDFSDAGVEALAVGVQANTTLTALYLGGNMISDVGAKILARVCVKFTTLEIGGNQIGDEGAAALAKCVRESATLTSLHLGTNQIGDAGAAALASAVRESTALATLTLPDNRIGAQGAQALADVVRVSLTLISLRLDRNPIGAVGAKAFADALHTRQFSAPFTLKIESIQSAAVSAWLEMFKDNTTLTQLTLLINEFPRSHIAELRSALRLNSSLTALEVQVEQLGIKWTTANLLPRQDRHQFRALLGMPVPDDDVHVERSFFVPWSDLPQHRTWLGGGGFGEVWKGCYLDEQGRDRPDRAPVGIKTFRVNTEGKVPSEEQRRHHVRLQLNELTLVLELGAQRAASLAATCVFANRFSVEDRNPATCTPPSMVMLLPLMDSSLGERLAQAYDVSDVLRWLADVAAALAALHEAGVVHRDLAVRNILLEMRDRLVAKLCDFGLSCVVASYAEPDKWDDSVWPPECMGRSAVDYGRCGDVWAFGLLVIDVLRRGRCVGHVNHRWLALPEGLEGRTALEQLKFDLDFMAQALLAEPEAVAVVDDAALSHPSAGSCAAASVSAHDDSLAAERSDRHHPGRYNRTDDKSPWSCSDRMSIGAIDLAPLDMAAEQTAWEARVTLTDELSGLSPTAGRLVQQLVAWCLCVDPARRPSMEMVGLVLRQVVTGRPSCNWLALPESIVPGRLHEEHWTVGDGELLAALCRHRRAPVDHVLPSDLIASDGGVQLLCALKRARQVQLPSELVLDPQVQIGDAGATALANVLRDDVTVHTLKLHRHAIGNAGAVALAAALQVNTHLTSLNLNMNYISDEGAIALANMIRHHRTLTQFYMTTLKGEGIGPDGLQVLASALQENTSLTRFYTPAGASEISEMVVPVFARPSTVDCDHGHGRGRGIFRGGDSGRGRGRGGGRGFFRGSASGPRGRGAQSGAQ
jgi:serine/threonine protein kinase/Ran GTPase-activating protein (RanGAP) involved in mRNA processing and transport